MNDLAGAWLWLFPLTYLAHLAEEALAGEGFYRWIRHVVGRTLERGTFLRLNAGFFAAMLAAVLLLRSTGGALWLVPALGTIIGLNGVAHLLASLVTRTYSPGLVSGLLLWVPLGVAALLRSHAERPAGEWWMGVGAGLLLHAAVALAALQSSRPERA